jgi:hypothetical protein
MSIGFPTTLDALSNPVGGDLLANTDPKLVHATQHSDANDAIEALEAKIGINNSANTDSLDYKVRHARFQSSSTTVSLAAEATDDDQTVSTGVALNITTNVPAWVRIYASVAAQTADSSRLITVDPVAGSGVLLEVLTTADALSIDLSPVAILYSATGDTTLPITVTNKDTSSQAVSVTITAVPIEG